MKQTKGANFRPGLNRFVINWNAGDGPPKAFADPRGDLERGGRQARECGVSMVSKALRLSYPDLKRRPRRWRPRPSRNDFSPTFLELACAPSLAPAHAWWKWSIRPA